MSSSSNNNGIRRNPTRSTSSSSSSSHSPAKSSNPPVRSTRAKNHIPSYNDSEENSCDEIKQISSSTTSKLNLNSNSQKSSSNASSNQATASAGNLDMSIVDRFESITGLSRSEAIEFLEANNNKLDKAVDLYFQTQNKASNSSNTNSKFGTKRNYSRLNNIDETSNSSEPFVSVVDDNTNDSTVDVDDVRAPIPQKIEKLLNYDPYALALAPQSKRMRVNAFDGYKPDEDGQPSYSTNSSSKSKTLGALFRPPVDLLFTGSFEASKIQGCKLNKWVLLNVQNQNEFNCQCLNRDVWSDDTVKEIVKENFIFVQIYCDSLEGKKLINYYNISSYPFLAIIDPRTGEKMRDLTSTKIDQLMFCEKVTTFLSDFEMPLNESELVHYQNGNAKGSNEIIKVDDEDDIVELNTNTNKNGAKASTSKSETKNNLNSKLTNGSKQHLNSYDKSKPKKANELISSIIADDKSEEYVEVEDSDVLSTDGSNSSDTVYNKKKLNGYSDGKKRFGSREDIDVNVENSDDDNDAVISKEKYEKDKLFNKQKNPNEIKNSTDDSKLSASNNNIKASTSSNLITSATTSKNTQPSQIRYETPDLEKKDCTLRILYPNGDRLDFCTNGNSKIKVLLDYLSMQGFKKNAHELIERLMPNMNKTTETEVTNQSRNLFNSNINLTFKELSLYPRVFLLLQES